MVTNSFSALLHCL